MVEGSMTIGIYDLFNIDAFLADMSHFEVMKLTVAETVGAAKQLVEILQMYAARRLEDASALEVWQVLPAQRLLQTLQHFIVDFRILTKDHGSLARRSLVTLETVSMYAMTFQMQQVMERQSLPRSYSIVIFNVTAMPVMHASSSVVTATNAPSSQKTSSGCQSLSPHDVFAMLWLYVAIGAHRFACSSW